MSPRPADRHSTTAIALTLTLSGAISLGCRPASRPATPDPTVSLVRVEAQTLPDQVRFQSTISAIDEIPMSPETDGRIVAMPMREGQIVKAGTLLYKLDQRPLESQAKADQAVAENARINALRFIRANFAGAVSNKESDDYATQARQSQEVYRSRKALLAYKVVRAPFDGQLGAINNKLGDYVTAGTRVTSLVDNRRLWIVLDVPDALGPRLRLGQPVRIRAPGLPAAHSLARVTFIAPELDVQRQTLMVRATIDNPSGALRHNQRVDAHLELGRAERTTIPATATQLQAGQSFAFVAQPLASGRNRYRLVLRPIRLGLPQQERYPVLSGLNRGELVVSGDLTTLRNGSVVAAAGPRR
ncbi:MAG: efflux RND transporter periplasmic adaptor subunit [Synechococcaceae cyanobacterium]|nr:efflux RND transporter periplasmic adaptor subunit [Synechococcaceae cyanobacterium]